MSRHTSSKALQVLVDYCNFSRRTLVSQQRRRLGTTGGDLRTKPNYQLGSDDESYDLRKQTEVYFFPNRIVLIIAPPQSTSHYQICHPTQWSYDMKYCNLRSAQATFG